MPGKSQFRVVYSEKVRNQFLAIVKKAALAGLRKLVLDTAKAIHQNLQDQPREFGEILYHLEEAKLEVRLGVKAPLAVIFGVHEEQPVVFVKEFFG